MQKKSNGEGTVYYSESRKQWIGQVTVGTNENGKPKRRSVYGKTKKEALKKMLEIQSDILNCKYVNPSKITVSMLIKSLIDDDKEMNHISDATYNRKLNTYNNIKKSELADIPIQQVQEFHIKKFLKGITKYSNSVIRKNYELLNRCFNEAVHKNIIIKNPMFDINRPNSTKGQQKTRALTLSEQSKLLDVFRTQNIPFSIQMQLMLLTGMRMGEINALDLDDINLDFKVINVRRSLTRDENEKPIIGTTTKTYAGMRKIPLSAPAVALLKEYLSNYTPNYKHLLFWDYKANKLITTNQVNHQFSRTIKKYEIVDMTIPGKVSLHSLRHTYATRCIEAGMQAKVLQKLLGHTDISVTLNTYCDAFGEFQQDNIEKFEQYIIEKKLSI